MTAVAGTLAIADLTIGIDDWVVAAMTGDGQTVAAQENLTVSAGASSPYVLRMGEVTKPVYVSAFPRINHRWAAGISANVGDIVVPSEGTPACFKAIVADPVPEDPLWDNVVFRSTLESEAKAVDDKGHAISLKSGSTLYFDSSVPFTGPPTTMFIGPGYSNLTVVSSDFDMGTGDFAIEFWVQCNGSPSNPAWVFALGNPASSSGIGLYYSVGGGSLSFINNGAVVDQIGFYGYWTFVSIDRVSGVVRVRTGGANSEPVSLAGAISGNLYIGRGYNDSDVVPYGHIYDFRVTKNAYRHSADFSPPYAESLSIGPPLAGNTEPAWTFNANDQFVDGSITWEYVGQAAKPVAEGWLLPSRSTAVADALSANVVFLAPLDSDRLDVKGAPIDNQWDPNYAQVVSPAPPPGGGSGRFFIPESVSRYSGVGYVVDGTALALGTGDFTIELWAKITFGDTDYYSLMEVGDMQYGEGVGLIYDGYNTQFAGINNGWDSNLLRSTISLVNGQTAWHHVAMSRSSGVVKLFVDGVGTATAALTTDLNPYSYASYADKNLVVIGGDSRKYNNYLDGYICDVRVTKGVARYWANFTRPASRFTSY